jgi:acyl-coenzyme A thioesterase PaaI-like protein
MTKTKNRLENFLRELKALEKKYDASVGYRMEGDTYGITHSALTVSFLEPLKEGDRFRAWSEPADIKRRTK